MKSSLFNQGSTLAVCLAAGLWAGSAAAQSGSEVSEVIVTGSFIAGTPEDAALPVDVIGADELERQGNPTTIELMKNLTVSGGIVGDHNQYIGQLGGLPAGVATVNLRNLGATRTLVLLNGRRLASIPVVNGPVDVNALPQAAIGRIEILKDGAAATYGSDAIGGVVNFITRKNFDGLQVSGDYRYVAGADEPDYSARALWGWQGERGDILLSAGWQVRGRLRANERDWNLPSYLENPDAGFSFTNNPTSFLPLTGTSTLGAQMRDPGCATVGAQAGFVGGNQVCLARIAGVFVNLIDPTSRWQLYGETNFELSDTVKFHAETFYTETKAVQRSSPGYPNTAPGPTALTSPFPNNYFVPASNPGLTLLRQQFPNAFPANLTGVVYPAINFRPFGLGGNPVFDGDDGVSTPVISKTYRISGGFSGKLFDSIGWDIAGTFHNVNIVTKGGWDTIVSRTQLALRGFGALAGDTNGCTSAETANFTTNAGNNALGCYYFNPFSNSFAQNSQYTAERPGAANPLFNPSVANPLELVKWMGGAATSDSTARLFVLDGVLNGELPIEFSGGKVGWAAGGQFRRNFYRTNYGALNNRLVTPCPDILIGGSCTSTPGAFSLIASSIPANIVQNVYAGFAEMAFPFTDDFSAHIAARYENYGENAGGDTFNPKLDVRWQALDWLAVRGSVGTTFRAPPLPLIDPSPVVTGVFINNAFRAIAQFGNPNLAPEKATTYSVGAIVEAGPFKGSIDYWNFDFQEPFTAESAAGIVSQMFPNNSDVNCNNPAFAALQSRLLFPSGVCGVNNFTQITTNWANAGGVKTDGVDVTGELSFQDIYGGDLTFGSQITWTHKYTVAEVVLQGVTVAGFEAVGKYNYNTGFYAMPEWRGNFYAEFETGPHNIRVQTSYIDGYVDQRTTPFIGNLVVGDVTNVAQATIVPRPQNGKKIDAFVSTDVTWRMFLPWDTTAVLNVSNIFDTPAVRATGSQLRRRRRQRTGPNLQNRDHQEVLIALRILSAVPRAGDQLTQGPWPWVFPFA